MVPYAAALVLRLDRTFEPGAKMSTREPKSLYQAHASVLSVTPTVMTPRLRLSPPAPAGEYKHASAFWLPAAMVTMCPAAATGADSRVPACQKAAPGRCGEDRGLARE
jgi:hypothetical protein